MIFYLQPKSDDEKRAKFGILLLGLVKWDDVSCTQPLSCKLVSYLARNRRSHGRNWYIGAIQRWRASIFLARIASVQETRKINTITNLLLLILVADEGKGMVGRHL